MEEAIDFLTETTISAMVDALAAAVPEEGAVYVSTPITTGSRFVAWRRGAGRELVRGSAEYAQGIEHHVTKPNIAEAGPIVARLRREGRTVIDPTGLEVEGWEQRHYHDLWTRVVDRYARSVLFVDGWEYSVGAVMEMDRAIVGGRELLDHDLHPLTVPEIVRRVEAAIADVETDEVIPSGQLRAVLASIEQHARASDA